ncbi:MAG: extracellular solute-binding protein [Acidimicrobiia bacterium]|nr:extracellular solute-binding protein [Acidimicrobiia bacterium]
MVPRRRSLYVPSTYRRGLSRRDFIKLGGLGLLAAACGGTEPSSTTAAGTTGAPGTTTAAGVEGGPEISFVEPAGELSGELRILLWSHFVPSHDTWFDTFAAEWGEQVGVNVTVDHIGTAEVVPAIASEIQAGEGHDLMQHISPLGQFEPSVVDLADVVEEAETRYGELLDVCRKSSFNPTTEKYYGYAPAWVPDPGNYRSSLWEQVDMADGPSTWNDLLEGGSRIKDELGVQLGLGLSQEIDSDMAGRALLWSFGASIQDENENVAINSPETIEAVEFMMQLFEGAMTEEVFAWNAASNNQGLVAGELSYVLNSISAYRTAQEANPEVASDVLFTPALEGPAAALVGQHVMYNWIVPEHAGNVDASKEFLLHYTENLASATWHSQLYDFPAFSERVPDLDTWLGDDPFGSEPADKLSVLSTALEWCTNVGHPGPASPATGEVFNTFVIPNMLGRAVQGEQSPQESVAQAEQEITQIFDNWRAEGLIGGG